MSSSDEAPGGASAGASSGSSVPSAARRFFCHQCDGAVSVAPSLSGHLACLLCGGEFVEELEAPNPNPNPTATRTISFEAYYPLFLTHSAAAAALPSLLSRRPVSFDLRSPRDLEAFIGSIPRCGAPSPAPATGSDPFDPLLFLQNHLQALLAGGANIEIEVVIDGGVGSRSNLRDYFFGTALEQLIEQLTDNDPNRYGTPPASKSAIESLPDIKITGDVLSSDQSQCAVCKDEFALGTEAKQMPCKHIYHQECILPWLEMHNSCPVCRFELPTDDPDYEQQARVGATQGEGNNSTRTVERSITISLPRTFGMFASQADSGEAEGSANGNGSDNSAEDLD